MLLLVAVVLLSGCAAVSRLAVGPVFDTHRAVGVQIAVSGSLGTAFETARGTSFVGPTAGIEVGGSTRPPHAALGFHFGVDNLNAFGSWAIGAGARLSASLAPPASYVGRFGALLDVGWRVRERSCVPYLGFGLEGGASFGDVPVTTSFALNLVTRWLCAPMTD